MSFRSERVTPFAFHDQEVFVHAKYPDDVKRASTITNQLGLGNELSGLQFGTPYMQDTSMHTGRATMRYTRTSSFRIFAAMLSLVCPAAFAQRPQPAAPPTPSKILDAKRVFVSNAGVDAASPVVFERTTGPNEPYSQFYFAMQRWGRYELVGTPSDADLVLQLRLTAPLSSCQITNRKLRSTILDSNTHFVLWTVTKRVKDARLKDNWEKNLKESIGDVFDELKQLATQSTVAN